MNGRVVWWRRQRHSGRTVCQHSPSTTVETPCSGSTRRGLHAAVTIKKLTTSPYLSQRMSRRFDQTKNYYATLGLANTADQKTIRTTYHQVALSVHPDKTGNHETTEDISELNEAYRVLSDETLRKRYTERRARQDRRRLYGTIDQM